jgi:gamma-glutamyltranspeptidase
VDAAVAVGSTLNVVEPFMSSAGGIGLMLISRAGGRERHVLDFIGPGPGGGRPRGPGRGRSGRRPRVVRDAKPGGWLAALERFGSMPAREGLRAGHRVGREAACRSRG